MAIGVCTASVAISMEVPKNLKVDQLSTLGCSQKDSKSAHQGGPCMSTFIAAQVTGARKQSWPRSPSTDERVKKMHMRVSCVRKE